MTKLLLRSLIVLAAFAGLTISAKAQADDQIIVKVPFPFVAAGKTLPAGQYRVSRFRDGEPRILLLTNLDNRADALILRVEPEETIQGKPQLDFAAVGDQHWLSRIKSEGIAYILSVPGSEPLMAAAPKKGATASSASGSN